MAVRLFCPFYYFPQCSFLTFQTPVAFQDEDILSDIVPSNIVSRQVHSCTYARGFQGAKTLSTFLIGYPG
jgi:hypothetical protein